MSIGSSSGGSQDIYGLTEFIRSSEVPSGAVKTEGNRFIPSPSGFSESSRAESSEPRDRWSDYRNAPEKMGLRALIL